MCVLPTGAPERELGNSCYRVHDTGVNGEAVYVRVTSWGS